MTTLTKSRTFQASPFWESQDGRLTKLTEMADEHLSNAIWKWRDTWVRQVAALQEAARSTTNAKLQRHLAKSLRDLERQGPQGTRKSDFATYDDLVAEHSRRQEAKNQTEKTRRYGNSTPLDVSLDGVMRAIQDAIDTINATVLTIPQPDRPHTRDMLASVVGHLALQQNKVRNHLDLNRR